MKGIFYLFIMLSLAALSSCKKDEPIRDPLLRNSDVSACGVKDPVNNLGWLKKIVLEAKKDGSDKYLIIRMADYNGDTYFNSRFPFSSCMGCNIRDCSGNRIDPQNFTIEQKTELMQALNGEKSVVLWGNWH